MTSKRDKDIASIFIVMFIIMFFATCNSCQKLNDMQEQLNKIENKIKR